MDRQDAKTPRKEPSAEVDSWARAVVDAAFEVHATLGPGYDVPRIKEGIRRIVRTQDLP